jgi:hypothetical protein
MSKNILPNDKFVESLWFDLDLFFKADRHHGCLDLLHFRPLESRKKKFI